MENGKLEKFNWNDLNIHNIDTFPSTKDLAILALIVYDQEYGSKVTYQTNDPEINSLLASWTLIATSCGGNGYNGAAFYNVTSKHLVVAHRGTGNAGSFYVDFAGVLLGKETSHMASAYHFTRKIVSKFRGCAISISVTGHSLGGWLSQMSAFFIKHPVIANTLPSSIKCGLNEDYLVESSHDSSPSYDPSHSNHLHVVTFDSPGAFHIVESYLLEMCPKYNDDRFYKERCIDDLDITTYFSSPNIVNVVNMHIGSLFIMRNIYIHSITAIVQFWLSTESVDKNLLKITDWPRGLKKHIKRKLLRILRQTAPNTENLTRPFDDRSFRMSIFESDEREFLKDIHDLKKLGIIEDKMSWATIYENTQTNEIIRTANATFSKLADSTQPKDIFGFFDSFKIDKYHQVLTLTNNGFMAKFFISLVKHFVKNSNLPAVVKEVIKNFPKYYRVLHRKYMFINGIKEVETGDIPSLNEFLKSVEHRVFQAIAAVSTLDCVEKIFSLLKSKRFSFHGNGNETLDITHALFLNTDLLTDLDRYVGIKKITPPNDDLKLIFVENSYKSMQPSLESLICKVIEAASTSLKVIVVTKNKISMPIENCPFYIEKEMEASDQSILFDHLTNEQQAEVFETEICFQGENMQLKNLISLEELRLSKAAVLSETTLRAFRRSSATNNVSFGGTLNTLDEFERSYYIPRHFHKIVLTDPRQFLNIYDKNKTSNFVLIVSYTEIDARNQILSLIGHSKPFFEWHGSFEGFNRMEHKLILVESARHRPNYNHFKSHFKKVASPAIWLFYDANKWYWNLSFGAVDLNHFKVSYEDQCNEQELLELQRQLVIICDEPGMGKSTLLKNISEECKKGRPEESSWVIFVNLNSHLGLLRKLEKSGDLVSVANFLIQIDDFSPSNSVGQSILEKCLHIEERVKIFFDGYDEIDDAIQSKVKDIVMALLNQTKSKVFLAGRIHSKNLLEKTFRCYSNTFLPLDNAEKFKFLTKFWTEHPELQEHRKNTIPMEDGIEKYAYKLLEKLPVSLNFKDIDKFVGVPLQLFMLGTVSLPTVSSFLSDVESNAGRDTDSILQDNIELFDNVFHLFHMFVKEKFHISTKEKLKLKQWAEEYPKCYNKLPPILFTESHRAISFQFLFPKEFQEFVGSVSTDDLLNNENIQEILSVGIVQNVSTDLSSIQFIHRSLAEYFAADFIVSRLIKVRWQKNVIEFLKRNYFHPQFEKIRFFVDHFISIQPECDPIFQKFLNFEKEKQNIFTMLNKNENKYCYDLLGRNVLHYTICYGDHFKGILWCLIQNRHLFHQEDMFGCSFLSYLVLLTNLELFDECNEFYDIYWILFIPGIVFEPTGSHDNSAIISQLRDVTKCDIKRYEEKMSELRVISQKLDVRSDRVITIFLNIILIFWNRTETFLNSFVIALMTSSEEHMYIAAYLISIVKYFLEEDLVFNKTYARLQTRDCRVELINNRFFEIYRKGSTINLRNKMLSLMTRNGCALFKYCVEHDVNLELQLELEMYLWQYYKEQRRVEEMYNFVKTTNFLTLRRICANNVLHDVTLHYLDFFEYLNDESLLQEMSVKSHNRINEIFEDGPRGTESDKICVEDSRRNGKFEFSWFHITKLIKSFCDTYSIPKENITLFDDVFYLFRMFVEEKFHIFMNEKLKLKELAEYSQWLYDNNLTYLTEAHCAISFRYLYPKEFQEFVGSVKCRHLLNDKNFKEILSVGIVQGVSNDLSSIQFIHRSLAEYFAADFLVSRLIKVRWQKNVIEFLKRKYFHPKFQKIRFFVDHFILMQPGCHPIFQKFLNFEKEKQNIFTMLNKNENKYCYDLLGRNVLHYAICYGDHCEGILWCLIQNRHLFHQADVFGCSFLSYAILLSNLKLNVLSFDDDSFPDIYWILLIPEAFESTGPHRDDSIIEQLKYSRDIIRFENRMTDLQQISKKWNYDYITDIFFNIIIKYWNCTTTFWNTFELALMTNSKVHVRIVDGLLVAAYKIEITGNEMLSLMKKDGCSYVQLLCRTRRIVFNRNYSLGILRKTKYRKGNG